jgi:hypothetical protein
LITNFCRSIYGLEVPRDEGGHRFHLGMHVELFIAAPEAGVDGALPNTQQAGGCPCRFSPAPVITGPVAPTRRAGQPPGDLCTPIGTNAPRREPRCSSAASPRPELRAASSLLLRVEYQRLAIAGKGATCSLRVVSHTPFPLVDKVK